MWKPISAGAMRHIIDQTTNSEVSDERVAQVARGFWTRSDSVFHFSAQQRILGNTQVMQSSHSAMRVRGRETHTTGIVHIGFLLTGSCEFGPADRISHSVGRGGFFVVPDWSSYDLTAREPTRVLNIRLPESRLIERGIRLGHSRFRGGEASSLGVPLREFATAIADTAWRPSKSGLIVAERTVEDLIVGMFLETSGYVMDSDDLRAGLRGRAIAVIAERHRDQSLDPHAVANQLGVSLRHLQRAFQDSEASVSGSIARRRAETAALLLSSPGAKTLTITELAARAGFASAFELRTAFRARYAELPSEYRGRAKAEQAVSAPHAVRIHDTDADEPGAHSVVNSSTA